MGYKGLRLHKKVHTKAPHMKPKPQRNRRQQEAHMSKREPGSHYGVHAHGHDHVHVHVNNLACQSRQLEQWLNMPIL